MSRQRAGGRLGEAVVSIGSPAWTKRRCAAFDIAVYLRVDDRIAQPAFSLERPSLFCAIDHLQVLDASRSLAFRPSFEQIGDRHRDQKADDGNDDHDLYKGKSLLPASC